MTTSGRRPFVPVPFEVVGVLTRKGETATGVGIFFGLYPARRAARLDPIEALRRE